MFTTKDIETKTIFVLNCSDGKNLRVSNGELLLEEKNSNKVKTLTKFPFQKILAIFVIGNISISSPLIEKCSKFGVALIVTKLSLRPLFVWGNYAEANFVLHHMQYKMESHDIRIAKILIANKLENQIANLKAVRKNGEKKISAIRLIEDYIRGIELTKDYHQLLGIEGSAAKIYFSVYFSEFNWNGRMPRAKCDMINVILDLAYTILFNFIECFLRMFGFDVYIGVFHRLWYKRKSLVCDIMEPFRCIIEKAVRLGLKKQFLKSDFIIYNGEYNLRHECAKDYYRYFFDVLIPYKTEIFRYVQTYYRCFMNNKQVEQYPKFKIS